MSFADKQTYLLDLVNEMKLQWPSNRTINIVCHGHSVPSGYFATPMVDTFNAYPHLIHRSLKEHFPFAVINVIVTGIGGENSEHGSERFDKEVLCHRPDIITLDYGLNDRGIGLAKAKTSWCSMIDKSLKNGIKLFLMTPTWDIDEQGDDAEKVTGISELALHAHQIRQLAYEYSTGLVDSYSAFQKYIQTTTGKLSDLLSWSNHPNRKGHELVRDEFMMWFPNR